RSLGPETLSIHVDRRDDPAAALGRLGVLAGGDFQPGPHLCEWLPLAHRAGERPTAEVAVAGLVGVVTGSAAVLGNRKRTVEIVRENRLQSLGGGRVLLGDALIPFHATEVEELQFEAVALALPVQRQNADV